MNAVDNCRNHSYEKKTVTLDDGFTYFYYQCPQCAEVEYPPRQAQLLLDYSKDHLFMFVEDWILVWMSIDIDSILPPVTGITALQKQMVILIFELAPRNNIPSENPGFKAYKFGPYTERIDRAVQSLDSAGYIFSKGRLNTKGERFYLTEKGMEKGTSLLSRLDESTVSDLHTLKRELQQFTLDGLETYVYSKYPEYTDRSKIFERVLHRKRARSYEDR